MTQRAFGLLASLFGMAIVVILVLLGIDAWQAARKGPRWKRRLVSAGLILLAMLGVATCDTQADPPKGKAPDTQMCRRAEWHETAAWSQLTSTWREASEVSSGKRGAYPFDQAGKKKLLAEIKSASETVAAFEKKGVLSKAESGLLRLDLEALRTGVMGMRPTEMKNATCYMGMFISPAKQSLTRLSKRMPMLKSMADSLVVKPEVVAKVLKSVERDIAVLADPKATKQLRKKDEIRKANEMRQKAAKIVELLKARLNHKDGGK